MVLPYYFEDDDNFVKEIYRETPRGRGVFIFGSVEDKEIYFTVDTGASTTILAKRIWDSLPDEVHQREIRLDEGPLVGPTGASIASLGRVLVNLRLGDLSLYHYVAVADIQDDCLLGADILLGLKEGPFDLLLSEGRIMWNGINIPCIQQGAQQRRRVECTTDCIVPRSLEDVDVTAKGANSDDSTDILQESNQQMMKRKSQLGVASSLANTSDFNCDSLICQGETIGSVLPLSKVIHLDDSTVDEINNVDEMRGLNEHVKDVHNAQQLTDFTKKFTTDFDEIDDQLKYAFEDDAEEDSFIRPTNEKFNVNERTTLMWTVIRDDGRLWPKLR